MRYVSRRAVGAPDYAPGMEVVLVDRLSGEAAEISRVTEVSPKDGHLRVDGYTSRFRIADGHGLPLVETTQQRSCEVVNMKGEVLRSFEEAAPVVVRKLRTRFNIRKATTADRVALSRREFTAHLAASFAKRGSLPVKADSQVIAFPRRG
jgi:hypothetical protein